MTEVLSFLSAGIVFGLAAGISPGPLFALVISETLKHNRKEGIKVAITPLFTDIPIILLTVLVLSKLSNSNIALSIVAFLGAVFLFYLGIGSIKTQGLDLDVDQMKPQSIKKGIIINALSPHPYLFWLTVGTPTFYRAYEINILASVLFIGGFYIFLVGSKIGIALITDRSRNFLKNKSYLWAIRILGILLILFAFIFLKDGLEYLNVI